MPRYPVEVQEAFFDLGASGYNPLAPPRSMGRDPRLGAYRRMSNVRIDYGMVQRRPAIQRLPWSGDTLGEHIQLNGKQSTSNALIGYNGQAGMVILVYEDANFCVVVTDREIWQWHQSRGNWVNLTPIYTTGTISITNGTTALTGIGTEWLDRRISNGQLINIPFGSADWYVIESVNSNTSITLLDTYTGATQVSQPYEIKRTFFPSARFHYNHHIYAQVFNGDLYVAGNTLGGRDTTGIPELAAVIRVQNIMRDNVDNTFAEYIYAKQPIITSTTPDFNDLLRQINGLSLLDDGRVMLCTYEGRPDGSVSFSRLRYSSPSDQLEWDGSPAGFIDVVSLPGEMYGMGRWGRSLTLHFEFGIAFAHLTGEDSTPVFIQPQPAATAGAIAAKTIKMTELGEMFLANGNMVTLFDGARTRPIGQQIQEDLANILPNADMRRVAFASVDYFRSQYRLWIPCNWRTTDTGRFTMCYVYDYGRGQWWPERYEGSITTASDIQRHTFDMANDWNERDDGFQLVSYPSYDRDGLGLVIQPAEDLLFSLSESPAAATDVKLDYLEDGDQENFYFETDDMDFGLPGVHKVIIGASLWSIGRASATSDSVELSFSTDRGVTKTLTQTLTVAHTAEQEVITEYHFDADPEQWRSAEAWRARIEVPSNETMQGIYHKLRVAYRVLIENRNL